MYLQHITSKRIEEHPQRVYLSREYIYYDIVYQQIHHRIRAIIFHGKGLYPLTEVIGNHSNVTITILGRVTDVQGIHHNTECFLMGDDGPPGTSSSCKGRTGPAIL